MRGASSGIPPCDSSLDTGRVANSLDTLLAPDRRSRADLFKSTTSDQNGHYEFTAIAPGDYKLFAWEEVEPEAWEDSDFLKDYEKLREKVVLDPGARAGVDLHLAILPDPQ